MPPWVAFVPRSTSLLAGRRIGCLSPRSLCNNVVSLRKTVRSASTHVSPTAINVRPDIPPANEELYYALSDLSGAAETYVNISRLQLALRGLAAQDAVTRVALLSMNSQIQAQRLAQLLLADALGNQLQWEKQLQQEAGDGRAVLLRYGERALVKRTPTKSNADTAKRMTSIPRVLYIKSYLFHHASCERTTWKCLSLR
jgi:hypothetical protein